MRSINVGIAVCPEFLCMMIGIYRSQEYMRIKMKRKIVDIGVVTLMISIGNILAWIINIIMGGGSIWGLFLSGGGYLKELGEAGFQAVIVRHEWWRLITCGYLHIGVFHLAANIYAFLIVGSSMEKYLGHTRFFLLYHAGMAVNAFLWCLIFKNGSMVGASIGIFVILGFYAARYRLDKSSKGFQLSRGQLNYIISYVVIGCLLGIGTIAVHLIGFVIGLIIGFYTPSSH